METLLSKTFADTFRLGFKDCLVFLIPVRVLVATSLFVACLFGFAFDVSAQKMPKPRTMKAPTAKCQQNGLEQAEVAELLSAHNMVRAELKLEPLTWDCSLELTAQRWADRAVTQHDEDTPFGESIFVSSTPTQNVGAVVVRWMLEQPNWDNRTGKCAAGKVCNHYTQIVWRSTKRIGCGINRSAAGKWKVFLVCHYDPAGNNGGRAY